ncbi:MAG: DUF1492 domain-containing protein [Clostridiales bacterium]|nr:DUF1492 domain-containing protein [Clostridiales bacterium]
MHNIKEENDKKKEYLWGYRDASRQLKRLEEELMELRLNILCPSVNQDGMPHGSGESDLSGYMSKVDELERKILKARYKRIRKFKEIRDRIERLEDENEKDVLVYRYIKGMKWEDICTKMQYSWRRIHYIHSKALETFEIGKSA